MRYIINHARRGAEQQTKEQTMNATMTMKIAATLRPMMVQNRNYTSIREVPATSRMEVAVSSVPAEVAEDILRHSPGATTVVVGMFARKGKEFLSFAAGSSDGFPYVCLAL